MKIFDKAKGVFVPGMASRPNVLAAFRCDFSCGEEEVEFLVAAHTFYRVYLNGVFLGAGPAPAPFGRLKADRYRLTGKLQKDNQLAVEVMGYVPEENNYATHESSVFFGEIRANGKVLAATGDENWKCGVLPYRDYAVETVAFGRRCPMEVYELREEDFYWRKGQIPGETACEIVAQALEETWKDGGEQEILTGCRIIEERRTAMPDFQELRDLVLNNFSSMEEISSDVKERNWWESDAYLERSGGENIQRPSFFWSGYRDGTFTGESREYRDGAGNWVYEINSPQKPFSLEYALKEPETGFIGLTFETEGSALVDISWNEFLNEKGQLPVKADSVNRIIRIRTKGGRISFEAMEPHYIKYIKILVQGEGSFRLMDFYVRRYRFPDEHRAQFLCSDRKLNQIYEAAKRTLLTNTLAFFLDSPERERGGWAGDSYWTGRTAAMLLSDTSVERAMLYDFLAADYSPMLKGSFPACASGGAKNDSCLMYTWNLFVLLELTDYYRRTGDEELKQDFKIRVETFMEASESLKNDLGLLENIPGSIFIDWSSSNGEINTHPISVAANGLYAMAAERLADMYGREEYREEAERVRRPIRAFYEEEKKKKYDPFTMYPYLPDSLSLKEGVLSGNGVYSEAAQYYSLWTGLLRKEDTVDLWQILKEQFGPSPEKYNGTAHLNVGRCGVFFGYMIRFELLSRLEETKLLEKEMKDLCGYMLAQDPGTFWETLNGMDSRNHGFGSHFGVVLMRDFLGLDIPDCLEKSIRFSPKPGSLLWAKGSICLEDGRISASWHKSQEGMELFLSAPKGYRIFLELPKESCFYKEMTVNGQKRAFARTIEAEEHIAVCIKS